MRPSREPDFCAGPAPGQRVGVGWHGGYCGQRTACRRGELFACETQQVTGISFDGGYGEYMIAPVSAVARFPDELSPVDAAPLLCAGITTFKAESVKGWYSGTSIDSQDTLAFSARASVRSMTKLFPWNA